MMIKKTAFAFTFLILTINILLVSCDPPIDTCGPFAQYFETTSFISSTARISVINEPVLLVTELEFNPSSASIDQFSILMRPIASYYSEKKAIRVSGFFNNYTFACSPPIPVSEESITDILITSNLPFNSNENVQENLAKYFDVIFLNRNLAYHRISLIEFLESEPFVPQEIYLILNSAPETEEALQFTVRYSQDGRSMDNYEFTTNPIIIKE